MTPDQIDCAIAEWRGWTKIQPVAVDRRRYGTQPNSEGCRYRIAMIPSYHKCLNALQEAVRGLNYDHTELFVQLLDGIILDDRKGVDENPIAYEFAITNATAIQRAEALLRTIGKWQEPST